MKLFEDLMLLVKSTVAKVSLPTSRYDVLTVNINEYLDPNPYFGHRFETALRDACLPRDDENERRLRARRFIVELFNQLRQRLPENIQCLQNASLLSVEHALKATQEPITELVAQFLSVEAVSACETQWRNLRHVKWCCTDTTDGFWAEVGSYRDAHGDNPFAELDTLAMTVLSLPFSNAGVERCFSDMSIVKSKRRNRFHPGGVIAQIDELETTLEPQQGNDLSDVEIEDDEGSPKYSEDITLLNPDSTASEGELLLKAFRTDRVGNVSEGEKIHCEAVVGVQTGTSSVEDRFEENSNPSSMKRDCVLLETCLVQRHVNDLQDGKNYPENEQYANFQEFRSVEGPESGIVRGSADKLARKSNEAGKQKGKGCIKGGAQAQLNCRVADDATREVCNNQRKIVRKRHHKRRKRRRAAPQKVEAESTLQ
ncbi:hypothetical protein HPB51_003387 [Rhipicephalus microplus]|uniref:HAT C-terminal dimerisation domain-containing protein n=1 Tax=Rhipicephalus microplus TaxID=6941 RepID=A0A9J6D3S8_RHIMP|nr:hypothetical protein HPB51_003387 [Rhipicephalus microplus]